MLAWRDQSALYLAPEPYELLWLSSEGCFKYPCTSAPSGHSVCMALRSATVKDGHAWGFEFGSGSGGGGTGAPFRAGLGRWDARTLRTRPWLGPDLFRRQLGGWLRRVAVVEVVEDAVCRSLALPGSVHTSKFVGVFLQVGDAMFEICSVSVGQDIQRSACDVPCLRM